MKNNKYKIEYKRLKKVLFASASGGVVTGMIVLGVASPASAQTVGSGTAVYTKNVGVSPMHMMRRWNSPSKAGSIADSFGLDRGKIVSELKSGKNMKQILQENGIDTTKLNVSVVNRKSHQKRMWKKNLNNLENTI